MLPGVAGIAVLIETARVLALLVPQELLAVIEMFPLTAVPDVETVIEFVPDPAVILHPAGNVHIYDVAFGTAVILYVRAVLLIHCSVAPVMLPGVAGAAGLTVTAKLLAALVPHELLAVTVIFPF